MGCWGTDPALVRGLIWAGWASPKGGSMELATEGQCAGVVLLALLVLVVLLAPRQVLPELLPVGGHRQAVVGALAGLYFLTLHLIAHYDLLNRPKQQPLLAQN